MYVYDLASLPLTLGWRVRVTSVRDNAKNLIAGVKGVSV